MRTNQQLKDLGQQLRDAIRAADATHSVTSFVAFLTRAYDFVRMASVSRANLNLVGSHAGVAIGQDGPSQMRLKDLAAFRAVHGSTVLYIPATPIRPPNWSSRWPKQAASDTCERAAETRR